MNNINIIGNLTKAPEVRTTQSGISVCSFTLAVRRPRVADTTDFLNCVAWRSSADFLGKYANKGSKVAVSGILTARNYEDKDGHKRTAYEIVADNVELCESRSSNNQQAKPSAFEEEMEDLIEIGTDEELPF